MSPTSSDPVVGNATWAGGGPLVSVVIPTHNRAHLLGRAIRSVLAQTYATLEIIVVDDASSDNTRDVVMRFDDARLRYVRNGENKGGAATRNVGIRAASGQYIAFLDDDDEWEPEKTRLQLDTMKRYQATLCRYHGEEYSEARRYQSRPTIGLDELRRGFFRGGGTSALMAYAELLRQVLFDESLPRCQDWDLCIRLAQITAIGYLPEALVRYNDGDHSRISNRIAHMDLPQLERQLTMFYKHRQFFGEKWFRRHVCSLLLYAVTRRADKYARLRYVAKHYGFFNVASALYARLVARAAEKLRGNDQQLIAREVSNG